MWRRFLYFVFTALILWYFARHWHDLVRVGDNLRSGTWYWILLAVFLQVGHYFFHSLTIRRAFKAMHIDRSTHEMVSVNLAALAVNVVAPSMNVSGMAYIVDDARKRGHPTTQALIATVISVIMDGLVFIGFAILVALVLLARGGLSMALLTSILVLLGIVLALIMAALYFWKRPNKLEPWLFFVKGERKAHWMAEWKTVTTLPVKFSELSKVLLPEIAAHTCNFLSLCVCFAAFHVHALSIKPAIAYTVGVLFVILSPTPMGIGFAESGMAVAMVGQGIPLPVATAITLAYRGLSFWIPFIIGTIVLHYTHLNAAQEEHVQSH